MRITSVHFLTCSFGELKNGKLIEKGTLCKMVRGHMVRWLAMHNITEQKDIRRFNELGYGFSAACSCETNYVFIKEA